MNKTLLIFGAAKLQRSLIEQSINLGFFTIAIDPDPNAECRKLVNVFKVVSGEDYTTTLAVTQKYKPCGLVTTATDKPLVMMARIAESLELPFYSVETAIISTDKYLMKNAFMHGKIPCSNGKLIYSPKDIGDEFKYPLILKPRDNSGSRGVLFCNCISDVETAFSEVEQFTKKDTILVEEYITGKEYSIESLHFNGITKVIQYTEKITTSLPYNVELGHMQPAKLSNDNRKKINALIQKIANVLGFANCASHTELKINDNGIFVIEASPRLGGDFITSHLVPLSTGINMEQALINIATGQNISFNPVKKASLISYINFPVGETVHSVITEKEMKDKFSAIKAFGFGLNIGEKTRLITNSLNRYGYFIISGSNLSGLLGKRDEICKFLSEKLLLH